MTLVKVTLCSYNVSSVGSDHDLKWKERMFSDQMFRDSDRAASICMGEDSIGGQTMCISGRKLLRQRLWAELRDSEVAGEGRARWT